VDMQVLIIDDDLELVAVLTLALERAGFGVWTAQDAPTARTTVSRRAVSRIAHRKTAPVTAT